MLCKIVSADVNVRGMSGAHIPPGPSLMGRGCCIPVHVVRLSYKLLGNVFSVRHACLSAAEGTRQKMQMQASHLCPMVAQPT